MVDEIILVSDVTVPLLCVLSIDDDICVTYSCLCSVFTGLLFTRFYCSLFSTSSNSGPTFWKLLRKIL